MTEDDDGAERLAELIADNEIRINALAARGIGLDQSSIDHQRLVKMCDALLPEGSPERVRFELDLQREYAKQLDAVETQVRHRTLLQGISLRNPHSN